MRKLKIIIYSKIATKPRSLVHLPTHDITLQLSTFRAALKKICSVLTWKFYLSTMLFCIILQHSFQRCVTISLSYSDDCEDSRILGRENFQSGRKYLTFRRHVLPSYLRFGAEDVGVTPQKAVIYAPVFITQSCLLSFDIHGSVYQDTVYWNDQKDATVWYNLLSLDCSTCFERYYGSSSGASKPFLQLLVIRTSLPAGVVGESDIAHHQELLNCIFTASCDTYVHHCLPVSWENQNSDFPTTPAVSEVRMYHQKL